MNGLALLCAFIFWGLLAFLFRWKIRLRITTDHSVVKVAVGCRVLMVKANAVFTLSSASFQGVIADCKDLMTGKKEKEDNDRADKPTKPKRGIVGSLNALWARISILLALRRRIKNLLYALTRKMEVKVLRVIISGGTGDAAQTAIISGALWMAWGAMMAHLHKRVKVTGHDISLSVQPDFAEPGLHIDLLSIVRLQTSHIIVKCMQMILWFRRAQRMLP